MKKIKPVLKKVDYLKDPEVAYTTKKLKIYNTFEDQELDEHLQLSILSPEACLLNMRKLINLAFNLQENGMPNKPIKHTIIILNQK